MMRARVTTEPAQVRCRIRELPEVHAARQRARAFAEALGFDAVACAELVIVVSELASNILKYGVAGEIVLSVVHDEALGAALCIEARDIGPPIADFERALRDGWTDTGPIDPAALFRRRGLAAGLGAVARLTDQLRHEPAAQGKAIVALRFVRRPHGRRSP